MNPPTPHRTRVTRGLRIGLAVVGVIVIVVIVAGLWRPRDESPVAQPDEYAGAYLAVCTSAGLARSGDSNGAYNTFFDEAHTVLHALAAATSGTARHETAALLEAKNRVETALATSSGSLATDLNELAVTTRAAMIVIDQPDPGACP